MGAVNGFDDRSGHTTMIPALEGQSLHTTHPGRAELYLVPPPEAETTGEDKEPTPATAVKQEATDASREGERQMRLSLVRGTVDARAVLRIGGEDIHLKVRLDVYNQPCICYADPPGGELEAKHRGVFIPCWMLFTTQTLRIRNEGRQLLFVRLKNSLAEELATVRKEGGAILPAFTFPYAVKMQPDHFLVERTVRKGDVLFVEDLSAGPDRFVDQRPPRIYLERFLEQEYSSNKKRIRFVMRARVVGADMSHPLFGRKFPDIRLARCLGKLPDEPVHSADVLSKYLVRNVVGLDELRGQYKRARRGIFYWLRWFRASLRVRAQIREEEKQYKR